MYIIQIDPSPSGYIAFCICQTIISDGKTHTPLFRRFFVAFFQHSANRKVSGLCPLTLCMNSMPDLAANGRRLSTDLVERFRQGGPVVQSPG